MLQTRYGVVRLGKDIAVIAQYCSDHPGTEITKSKEFLDAVKVCGQIAAEMTSDSARAVKAISENRIKLRFANELSASIRDLADVLSQNPALSGEAYKKFGQKYTDAFQNITKRAQDNEL